MTRGNRLLVAFVAGLFSLGAEADQFGTELITFTADVTSSQGVNAGSVITGSILYDPTYPSYYPSEQASWFYGSLSPSVFSVVSNGTLAETLPLAGITGQTGYDIFPGAVDFSSAGNPNPVMTLDFYNMLNRTPFGAGEGGPVAPIVLADWGSATFTYDAYDSLQNVIGQVTANLTSVNVAIPAPAPEIDAGTAPVAVTLVCGAIAILRGRRIAG